MSKEPKSLDELLKAWIAGESDAGEQIIAIVYSELKQIASRVLKKEKNVTLQTTELVNECYMRLRSSSPKTIIDKAHFMNIASRAMRQVLVENVRRKSAQRRAGEQYCVTLNDAYNVIKGKPLCLLQLDDALAELEVLDPRKAHLVELRFFTGLSNEETAAVMDISVSTVKREWHIARAWLYKKLRDS